MAYRRRLEVGLSDWLLRAGLVRPGLDLVIGAAVNGLVARVMGSSVAVPLQVPPFTVYEGPADERILSRVRALGGVLNPGDLASGDVHKALADPLDAGRVGRPARHQRRRGFWHQREIWLLHWNDELLSVAAVPGA